MPYARVTILFTTGQPVVLPLDEKSVDQLLIAIVRNEPLITFGGLLSPQHSIVTATPAGSTDAATTVLRMHDVRSIQIETSEKAAGKAVAKALHPILTISE